MVRRLGAGVREACISNPWDHGYISPFIKSCWPQGYLCIHQILTDHLSCVKVFWGQSNEQENKILPTWAFHCKGCSLGLNERALKVLCTVPGTEMVCKNFFDKMNVESIDIWRWWHLPFVHKYSQKQSPYNINKAIAFPRTISFHGNH